MCSAPLETILNAQWAPAFAEVPPITPRWWTLPCWCVESPEQSATLGVYLHDNNMTGRHRKHLPGTIHFTSNNTCQGGMYDARIDEVRASKQHINRCLGIWAGSMGQDRQHEVYGMYPCHADRFTPTLRWRNRPQRK